MPASVVIDLFSFGAGVIRLVSKIPSDVDIPKLVEQLEIKQGKVQWRGKMYTQRAFFPHLYNRVLSSIFLKKSFGPQLELEPPQGYVYLAATKSESTRGAETSTLRSLAALAFRIPNPEDVPDEVVKKCLKARWGLRSGEYIFLSKRGAVVLSSSIRGTQNAARRKRFRFMLEFLGAIVQLQVAWLDALPQAVDVASNLENDTLRNLLSMLAVELNPDLFLGNAAKCYLPSATWRSVYRRYAQAFNLSRRWRIAWTTTMQLARGEISARYSDFISQLLHLQPHNLVLALRSMAKIQTKVMAVDDLQATHNLSSEAAQVLRSLIHAYISDSFEQIQRYKLGERSRRQIGLMTGLGREIYGGKRRRDPVKELLRSGLVVSTDRKSVGRRGKTLFLRINISHPDILRLLARIDPSVIDS
ncbi:MAG: hypothetical protein ACFFCO_12915 [Promethearchaeota archaeon]